MHEVGLIKSSPQKIIADNRKALHDYHVLDTWEAGLALLGTEVKAIREGSVNLRDSYARIQNGEVWLMNVHISPYSHTGYAHHAERRDRKLLLHRAQINKLIGAVEREGMTVVPLKLYFNEKGRAKIEVALARGKKLHDKRETEKKRDWDRERGRLMRAKG